MFAALLSTPSCSPPSPTAAAAPDCSPLCCAHFCCCLFRQSNLAFIRTPQQQQQQLQTLPESSRSEYLHLFVSSRYICIYSSLSRSLSAAQQSLIPPSLVKNHLKFHHHKFVKKFSGFVCRFGLVLVCLALL